MQPWFNRTLYGIENPCYGQLTAAVDQQVTNSRQRELLFTTGITKRLAVLLPPLN